VSVISGSTVSSAVETISTAVGEHLVVLAGGDQPVPSDIRSAPWQALARLNMLPGVRVGIVTPVEAESASSSAEGHPKDTSVTHWAEKSPVHELRRLARNEVISLCVREAVGMENALETLSRISGYAFDVSGSPAASFTLSSKGTVEEVVEQLSSAAGVRTFIVR
jgi:4-diphosphocytidyl-2C-methyl-D-erythritol kinase